VKKVDKKTKTVVIKTGDGTEHTIKYTEKTTVEGTKDAGKRGEGFHRDLPRGQERGRRSQCTTRRRVLRRLPPV
jgi:hypothetical protein